MLSQTQVLDRISKLLAIQEARGATEKEAQQAAEHVQRLLQKYNLTLSEVERHGSADQSRRKDGISIRNNNMPYLDRLAVGVAATNFCMTRVGSRLEGKARRRHVTLVGREVNVIATKLTFEYLLEACFREMRDHNYQLTSGGEYNREALWFLEGMSDRLVSRLQKLREEREAESAQQATAAQGNGTHRELVLSDVYGSEQDLNNDFLNDFPAGTTAARRREEQEKAARIEAELQRLQTEGMEYVEAWYRANGYGEKSVEYAHAYHRRHNRGGGRGYSYGASSRDRANSQKTSSTAYRQGAAAGQAVSLSQQVGASSAKRITKE